MAFFGKFRILFILALGALPALAADTPNEPTWPLDLSTRYLTSNFMEFRDGRFHAGLDLKTQSRTGFVVRAVEDGYISRVRCTPTAYGRVIYLRGVSGRTYVFAHLARFNDDLRLRVEQVQQQNQTYRARLEFKAGQIPIKKGQVLGISGQSGTGGPHLHFEVRDRNQRPINPLSFGFKVDDTLLPVLHRLRAWPVAQSSRINGHEGEWILDASSAEGLRGDLGILHISGPVAFSARMIDAADIRGHKLEPWLIELSLDGQVVYRCQNDRYAFHENSLQRLEWTDWADPHALREHWLHRRQANTLHGREGDLWYLGQEGTGLSTGDHTLELRAVDHAGGEATVHLILRVTEDNPNPTKNGGWKEDSLGYSRGDSNQCRLTPFFSSGEPEKMFTVLNLHPQQQEEILEPFEMWVGVVDLDSLSLNVARGQGLRSMGNGVEYLAADWPIDSSVPVAWPATVDNTAIIDSGTSVGVYRLNRKNEWNLVTTLANAAPDGFLLEEPGLHGVFVDVAPPVFRNFTNTILVEKRPVASIEGVTYSPWDISPVGLVDVGSGVDTGTIAATFDGKMLIVEPDSPRDRLLIHWPESMAFGEHHLHLVVSDRAGNITTADYVVVVLEPSQ